MATKTFMGFTYDDNSCVGGLKEGGYNVDFGFGKDNPAPFKLIEEIYRLEYVSHQVANHVQRMEASGVDVPTRLSVRLGDMRTALERALDAENARIAFAMHLRSRWQVEPELIRVEKNKRDLALVGDIDVLTERAIRTGKLPNGKHIPSSIFLGSVLPNGKRVSQSHIKHLDTAGFGNVWNWVSRMVPDEAGKRIRKFIDAEYREPEFDKMMQSFISAIKGVKDAKTLDEKLIAFHVTLSVAHCSNFIVNNVYGNGTVEKLDRLTAMHDPRWDAEVSALLR